MSRRFIAFLVVVVRNTHHLRRIRFILLISLSRCAVGIPNLLWYGVEGDYNVMVIELLGPRYIQCVDTMHVCAFFSSFVWTLFTERLLSLSQPGRSVYVLFEKVQLENGGNARRSIGKLPARFPPHSGCS